MISHYRNRRFRSAVYLVVVSSFAVLLCGCSDEKPTTLQGYVEGEYVYMSAPFAGILQSLDVRESDRVTSGQTLFSLDPEKQQAAVKEAAMRLEQGQALLTDARLGKRPSEIDQLEAQLKQAQAALTLSLKTFERQKKLYENKTIAAEDFDVARSQAEQNRERVAAIEAELSTARQGARVNQVKAAEANVAALQAALRKAQWDLQQTTQTAPQNALVFDTYFRPGEVVPVGRPVVSLLPPGRIRVRAFVPEQSVGALDLGTSATILIDGMADSFDGHVTFISPQAEFTPPVIYSREMREKLSFMIEVSFPPEIAARLHPGQPVDVLIDGVTP